MKNNQLNTSLDHLTAQLNVMTTDVIFSQHHCVHKAIAIAQQLKKICSHPELGFFPEQQKIYFKMLKVWKTLAYDESSANHEHSSEQKQPSQSQAIH